MANLFWTHPNGDAHVVPCVHMVPQHPNGDNIIVPCTHNWVQQHPDGDEITLPTGNKVKVSCIHYGPPHPNGDVHNVPCVHLIPQHPAGDTIMVACVHPLTPVLVEQGGALVFYTNNTELQGFVHDGIRLLSNLGANILATGRPLNIFNRAAANGNPNANDDPFWSHYDRLTHSIQITFGNTGSRMRNILFHEMGHALVGNACVRIPTQGGQHEMHTATTPAQALSEGWAHFVGAAMLNSPNSTAPTFLGENWETLKRGKTPNPNIEYSVGMCLWDLFDGNNDGNEDAKFSFLELLKVFQPTFPTLTSGPVLKDIFDYCDRLIKNTPEQVKKDAINRVRIKNVGR